MPMPKSFRSRARRNGEVDDASTISLTAFSPILPAKESEDSLHARPTSGDA